MSISWKIDGNANQIPSDTMATTTKRKMKATRNEQKVMGIAM